MNTYLAPIHALLCPMFRAATFALMPLCLALSFTSCKDKQPTGPAPIEVKVAPVQQRDVEVSSEFVGQTKGAIDADIRARVEGVVLGMHFEEGKEVQEGQLLYTIDPAPYQAKLAQANGVLAEANTRLVKASVDLKRIEPLAKVNAVSKRDLDAAIAQKGVAEGAVEAAKAGVESAEIELGYTKISSPTTGIIGISKAKIGEFVGREPNPVVLNVVSKLDPIHVRFTVSEKEYLFFAKRNIDGQNEEQRPKNQALDLILADGSVYSEKGKLAYIDRQIDAQTGSLTAEAAFPNPKQLIRPGQFGKIRVIAEKITNALLVPTRAIREQQGRYTVFVLTAENTVDEREVKLGSLSGNDRVITEGLKAGERIVVEGIQLLRTGAKVNAKEESAQVKQ